MKVNELMPGMVIAGEGGLPFSVDYAVVIAVHSVHPEYRRLSLVLWEVHMNGGQRFFSHDALNPMQDVGEQDPLADQSPSACWQRLLTILPGPRS